MALPASREAGVFYRSAQQRLDDAKFLREGGRTTAAIYLAGYSVECILKALILDSLPNVRDRLAVLDSFRGAKAHDFEWLRRQYFRQGGPQIPREISSSFSYVQAWSTDLRYAPGTVSDREAWRFIVAASQIFVWADGRL